MTQKTKGYAGRISNCAAQVVKAPLAKTAKKAKSIVKRSDEKNG